MTTEFYHPLQLLTGIAPKQTPYIVNLFYSNKEGGTGLGLAVTHSIIQKNNAKISVQSQAGQGTRFILSLPLVNRSQGA